MRKWLAGCLILAVFGVLAGCGAGTSRSRWSIRCSFVNAGRVFLTIT